VGYKKYNLQANSEHCFEGKSLLDAAAKYALFDFLLHVITNLGKK